MDSSIFKFFFLPALLYRVAKDIQLIYKCGVNPLITMRIVCHSDYQATADISTCIKEEALKIWRGVQELVV